MKRLLKHRYLLSLLTVAVGVLLLGAVTDRNCSAAEKPKIDNAVAILGLGAGPVFWNDRNNSGFLLIVNGAEYMVDCGAGTPNQIFRLGLQYGPLKNIFFTHFHFDHFAGLPDLMARAYQTRPNGLTSLSLWGPPGLQQISDGFMAGLDVGFKLHNWNPKRPNLPPQPDVHEFLLPQKGVQQIYSDDNVTVTATRAFHDVDVPNAYAYRFDIVSGPAKGKSVVFSGDTVKNDQVIALAKDATMLVHEVGLDSYAEKISPKGTPLYKHLVNSHTDASQIPEIGKESNVGMIVLQHYGNVGSQFTLEQARDIISEAVQKANGAGIYTGKIVVPLELDVIPIP